MIKHKDSVGKDIYMKDEVEYVTLNPMGEGVQRSGYVVALLPEGMVEVQSHDGGVPILVEAMLTTVTRSIISDVLSLKTHEEFQRVIIEAEERYRTAMERDRMSKNSRRAPNKLGNREKRVGTVGKRGGKVIPDVVPMDLDFG